MQYFILSYGLKFSMQSNENDYAHGRFLVECNWSLIYRNSTLHTIIYGITKREEKGQVLHQKHTPYLHPRDELFVELEQKLPQ